MRRYIFFVIIAISLSGCGRVYVMDRQDMYLMPSPTEMSKKFSVFGEILDPVRDLAEGGQGRFAWNSFLINSSGEQENYLAVSIGYRDEKGNKVLLTMVPKSLDEIKGSYYFSVDHGGTRIYNHLGQAKKLPKMSKRIKPEDYKDFLTVIDGTEPYIMEVSTDSQEFKNLMEIYKGFRSQELELAREYFYKKYGSNLSEKEIEKISWEDSVVRSFADWLGRDWKLFLVYPFMSIGNTAIVGGFAKIFTLPSIWGDKINKPGYMEYITDAETTAEMILRGIAEYGSK